MPGKTESVLGLDFRQAKACVLGPLLSHASSIRQHLSGRDQASQATGDEIVKQVVQQQYAHVNAGLDADKVEAVARQKMPDPIVAQIVVAGVVMVALEPRMAPKHGASRLKHPTAFLGEQLETADMFQHLTTEKMVHATVPKWEPPIFYQ